jgi:DNA (cytosine-5)-methyltransferase 1
VREASEIAGCDQCEADYRYLRDVKLTAPSPGRAIRAADLFCGLGGLSLGLSEAGRRLGLGLDVALAVDNDRTALGAYSANIGCREALPDAVERLFNGALGSPLTKSEVELAQRVGPIDILVGGPPCQGVSSLNNWTRMSDDRNALYARMARAAEVLSPKIVVIENVPGVRRDTSDVVGVTTSALEAAGYVTTTMIVQMTELGVPQRRRRLILLALRSQDVMPEQLVVKAHGCGHTRTVAWAIADLMGQQTSGDLDKPTQLSKKSRKRIEYLIRQDRFDLPNELRPRCHSGDHSYVSMYGRLRWTEPAQTITSGFGSMGQGRFVHPQLPRTLTAHEAARLQTIPDSYRFPVSASRTQIAGLIANAVPPLANVALFDAILSSQFMAWKGTTPSAAVVAA